MTYVALSPDIGDGLPLCQPDLLESEVLVAPCCDVYEPELDMCSLLAQVSIPEQSSREHSSSDLFPPVHVITQLTETPVDLTESEYPGEGSASGDADSTAQLAGRTLARSRGVVSRTSLDFYSRTMAPPELLPFFESESTHSSMPELSQPSNRLQPDSPIGKDPDGSDNDAGLAPAPPNAVSDSRGERNPADPQSTPHPNVESHIDSDTPPSLFAQTPPDPPDNSDPSDELDTLDDSDTPENPAISEDSDGPVDFSVFPVGINVGERNVDLSVLIKGQEDGRQALNFNQWLVPYDALVQSLRLSVTPLPDGQLEVRSPGFVTVLDPDTITNDSDLGLVFSIEDIEEVFGVPASFDINEYSIRFEPAWLTLRGTGFAGEDLPVVLDGLPIISAPEFSLTQVEQRAIIADRSDFDASYQGDFQAVGTFQGASWFFRVNQAQIDEAESWQLAEAQLLRQRDHLDITAGSQAAFWQDEGSTDLWGLTVVGRNGFTPFNFQLGATDPRRRLQSSDVGRTIRGEAEPGTLVQLTEGFGNRVISEVSVDSSGVYRFDNVRVSNELAARNYRLLLYPRGRLTEAPEIRDVSFSNVGGQIPNDASAWALSLGWDRESSPGEGFLGEFDDPRAGGTYRYGLTESTTVGAGIVYDNGARALGEVFLQPTRIPLQLAVSALTPDNDGDWDWDASLRYDPTPTLSFDLDSDPIETRLDAGWQVIPELEIIGIVRTDSPDEAGFQVSLSGQNAFTYARVTLDTDREFRWNGIQRWGNAELTTRGDDISTFSEFSYNFSGDRIFDSGHSALVSYESRDLNDTTGNLTTVGWRYRSSKRANDGNPLWEGQLGVAFGSEGAGAVASVQTAVIPGLLLRARYDGISATSNDDAFRLELVSSFRTQNRVRPGDRRATYLRTQGGLLIEAFLDNNENGKRDRGEEWYTDNADLLLILNNDPIQQYRPEINTNDITVRVPPGTYRLDLDPAGFPLDWQPDTRAFAVEVTAGSFTAIQVPFVPSYSLAGVATDEDGNPISGGRIEAISSTGERRFSVTNEAGVYYIEGLRRDTYTIQINGEPAQPRTIQFDENSEPFQELNIVR